MDPNTCLLNLSDHDPDDLDAILPRQRAAPQGPRGGFVRFVRFDWWPVLSGLQHTSFNTIFFWQPQGREERRLLRGFTVPGSGGVDAQSFTKRRSPTLRSQTASTETKHPKRKCTEIGTTIQPPIQNTVSGAGA